jgi:hypothetical protein
MGAALPVLIGFPVEGAPGGERERPVDGGAFDMALGGGAFDMALGGALAGALEEAPPGVGGGERDLGAEGGGCALVALAFGACGVLGGGGPGPFGGGPCPFAPPLGP